VTTKHIERFDEVATSILKDMYRRFPATSYPTPTTIGLTTEVPDNSDGDSKVSEEYEAFASEVRGAMQWLIEEGYVSDRGYKFGASYVLSSDGLKALERIAPECRAPLIMS